MAETYPVPTLEEAHAAAVNAVAVVVLVDGWLRRRRRCSLEQLRDHEDWSFPLDMMVRLVKNFIVGEFEAPPLKKPPKRLARDLADYLAPRVVAEWDDIP